MLGPRVSMHRTSSDDHESATEHGEYLQGQGAGSVLQDFSMAALRMANALMGRFLQGEVLVPIAINDAPDDVHVTRIEL